MQNTIKDVTDMKTVNATESTATPVESVSVEQTEVVKAEAVPSILMHNTGTNLDLKTLGLDETHLSKIKEVKNSIGTVDNLAIANYGKGLSSRSSQTTNELLSMVKNKDLDETGQKLNQVLIAAKEFNASNLVGNTSPFSRLPIIGGLFRSVEKAKENFAMKYNDTNKQIDGLITEIEMNQTGLNKRITMLENMFGCVEEEIVEIGVYIASGQLLKSEIQDELKKLTAHAVDDQTTVQKVSDLNNKLNTLDKRLHDLYTLQQASRLMLPQIRIIQSNNMMLVDKFSSIKTITIPAWKNQISLQISLLEQQNSVDLANTIDDATNSLLLKNAEMLKNNSIKTAKAAQRSIIDPETLAKVQTSLIETVQEVIQIQDAGNKARVAATAQLTQLQDNYKNTVVSDALKISMKR